MLYFPFTLICPLFSIVPVEAAILESPIYPAAIPTLYTWLAGSEAPTEIIPLFLAFPPFTVYTPTFPIPLLKSIFPLFSIEPAA